MSRPVPASPEPTAAPAWGASLADPGPLGLAAFAMTTFVLSCVNSNLIPATVEATVFGLAFFYGGLVQLLAGMWEFARGNTFGAVAFSSYGAFWLSFWYLASHPELLAAAKGDAHKGIGTYLLGWTIFTAFMTIGTLRLNGALIGVFSALTITFALLTLGEYFESSNITKAGGYFGLLTALLAWYTAAAGVINVTEKRVLLPLFPRS
jgi:succinate-acetate transporter protein